MFIGHYAVAFAFKPVVPRLSLGMLFIAVQLTDLIFPICLLLGLEHLNIVPGITAVSPFEFVHYPITHSLLGTVGWAIGLALLHFVIWRDVKCFLAIGLGVLSHWVLDAVAHRPDLLLIPGGDVRVGLGLWHSLIGTVVVELGLLGVGMWLYLHKTHAVDRMGHYGFWGMCFILVLSWVVHLLGSPPSDTSHAAILLFGIWVFVPWAYWVDRHRCIKI